MPDADWDALAALPVDAVWLMGVWQRSPAGLEIALADPALDAANRAALPDLRDGDVIGSPYCVRDYVVDERFGGPDALARAREQLARRGLGLILDYVPNHVAPDHPWTTSRRDCLLTGTEEELERDPDAFLRTAGGVVAKGRDPYFPAWPDVAQLDAFAPALREAVAETLIAIGEQCDGVRCDMAMLMTNEVFSRTWGGEAGPGPGGGLLAAVDRARQAGAPGHALHRRGLLGHGVDAAAAGVRPLLRQAPLRPARIRARGVRARASGGRRGYQERLLRFIENHDEPRAAATFGPEQARAAAVAMSTLRGARLYHDGQLDGRRTRIPVFLGRGPDEPPDHDLRAFYARLLQAVSDAGVRDGDWQLCDCSGWPDNDSYRRLVAWCWSTAGARHLVVINLSDAPAQALVRLPVGGPPRTAVGAHGPARRAALRARWRRAGRRRPLRRT